MFGGGGGSVVDKKMNMKAWKSKLSSIVSSKSGSAPQGVSTAMDARLETGVELSAELRLRVSVPACRIMSISHS